MRTMFDQLLLHVAKSRCKQLHPTDPGLSVVCCIERALFPQETDSMNILHGDREASQHAIMPKVAKQYKYTTLKSRRSLYCIVDLTVPCPSDDALEEQSSAVRMALRRHVLGLFRTNEPATRLRKRRNGCTCDVRISPCRDLGHPLLGRSSWPSESTSLLLLLPPIAA